MPNPALNRTTQVLLTNKSGGALVYGDVVVLDNTNANGFTTTTSAGLSTRGLGVILEPNGIANNASGMVAVGGWCPRVNLNTAAAVGQFLKTHTVAGQATPHASPQVEGDFAVALDASATPSCNLFGSPNGPLSGVSAGAITASGLTMATAHILGRTTASTGAIEEITVGTGLSLSAGALTATGGGGAWTQLSQIVTSGSQATVDFTSISGAYNTLVVIFQAQATLAGTSSSLHYLLVNNDTTSGNYTTTQRIGAQNGGQFNTTVSPSAQGMFVSTIPNVGNTSLCVEGQVWFPYYAGTTFTKRMNTQSGTEDTTNGATILNASARWKSTAAITRLTFGTDGTAFTDGSIYTLYGVN